MELVFGQKSHPVDTLLLIRAQFCFDWYRDNICLHLAIVEKLRQKVSLRLPLDKHVLADTGRIRNAGL
jgi:hypothetical protein